MFSQWRIRSALALMLVIASIMSCLPIYAQSDPSASSQPIKIFLPLISSTDTTDVDKADNVASGEVDAAAAALPALGSLSFADSKRLTPIDLSADPNIGLASSNEVTAAKPEVCLVNTFQGVLAPYTYGQVGAFATTNTCKKIYVGLTPDSESLYVRVRYLKQGTVKYSKWFFVPDDNYYHSLMSNPKGGTLFWLEFYNPNQYTIHYGLVQGATAH